MIIENFIEYWSFKNECIWWSRRKNVKNWEKKCQKWQNWENSDKMAEMAKIEKIRIFWRKTYIAENLQNVNIILLEEQCKNKENIFGGAEDIICDYIIFKFLLKNNIKILKRLTF